MRIAHQHLVIQKPAGVLKTSTVKYETDHKVLAFVVGFKERIKLNRSFVPHVQLHLSLHFLTLH